MKIDEAENLKFDIELLTDEKAMIQSELDQVQATLRDVEAKGHGDERAKEELAIRYEKQMRQLNEIHENEIH